jgi:hypothetical protein
MRVSSSMVSSLNKVYVQQVSLSLPRGPDIMPCMHRFFRPQENYASHPYLEQIQCKV